MMDMVSSDDKGVAIAAIHCQGIVLGMADLAIFECDVVTSYETHGRAATLEIDSSNSQIFAIDKLYVVVSVGDIIRMSEQWFLSFGCANYNGLLGSAFSSDCPAGGLRIADDAGHPLKQALHDGLIVRIVFLEPRGTVLIVNDWRVNNAFQQVDAARRLQIRIRSGANAARIRLR